MLISKQGWYAARNVNTRAFDLIISALRLLDISFVTLLRLIGVRAHSLSMQGAYNLAFTLSSPTMNRFTYKWPDDVFQWAAVSVDETKYVHQFALSIQIHLDMHFLETPTPNRKKLIIYKVLQKNSLEQMK